MPRVGVDYETIKHTAIKLLSQGHAPSVQKVREALGTGSNTTIAEHLKMWRQEHASKEIHHLPANMPKELIGAIEVLWQTAMDQAALQLSAVKHDLNEQQEKFRLDKAAFEQSDAELRVRLQDTIKNSDDKTNQMQALQTEVAVLNEKFKQQSDEMINTKNQYEKKLHRAFTEKNNEIEKNEQLQSEITRLNNHITDQATQHQSLINDERISQEESEKRWIKLIDQARTETGEQRKRSENIISKQAIQIEKSQSMLSDFQEKHATQQSILNLKNARIDELNDLYNHIQIKYLEASTAVAVLQERLNHKDKQAEKFKKIKPLKMAG